MYGAEYTSVVRRRSVANYGILFGRCESPIVSHCERCCTVCVVFLSHILSGKFDSFVWKHVTKYVSVQQEQSVQVHSQGPPEQKPIKIWEKRERGRIQRLSKYFEYPLLSQEWVKLRTSNFVSTFIGSIETKAH